MYRLTTRGNTDSHGDRPSSLTSSYRNSVWDQSLPSELCSDSRFIVWCSVRLKFWYLTWELINNVGLFFSALKSTETKKQSTSNLNILNLRTISKNQSDTVEKHTFHSLKSKRTFESLWYRELKSSVHLNVKVNKGMNWQLRFIFIKKSNKFQKFCVEVTKLS